MAAPFDGSALAQLADVPADCITGGASARFMAPLSMAWTEAGVIPDHAMFPDRRLCGVLEAVGAVRAFHW